MNYIGYEPGPAGVVLVGDTNPIGAIAFFHAPPDGSYLALNGQVVSKTTYAALWAYAQGFLTADQVLNPGLYKSIDGSTFAVPRLDGLFIRAQGVIGGSSSGALGAVQGDDNKAHTHIEQTVDGSGGSIVGPGTNTVGTAINPRIPTTGSTGGTETRPTNVALVPCVKALRAVMIPATAMPLPAVQLLGDKQCTGQTVVDFTNLVGYAAYRFVFGGVRPSTDNNSLCVRVSADNGSSFDAGAGLYTSTASGWRDGAVAVTSNGPNTQGIVGIASVLSNVGNHGIVGEMLTGELGLTAMKWFNFHCVYPHIGGPVTAHADGGFVYTGALGAINAIRFVMGVGTFAAGRILCYGLRGA